MKFRTKTQTTKTINKAGGKAYIANPEYELVSLLLTSFVNDKFYESSKEQLDRLRNLVNSIQDKKFVAKAAIFARTEFGMRSITHALLGELSKEVKGEQWTKNAISKTIYRPDDALETLSYYLTNYGFPIPNCLKKGLSLGVNKFNGYQLAKYRGEQSSLKMVDLFNLIHPAPTEDNKEIYKQLIDGTLKSTGKNATWETKLTQSGQTAETEEEKTELKATAWKELLSNKKLGYFALLRNLRNILKQSPDSLDIALEQLVDENAIKRSLVMPFRFITAYNEIRKESNSRKVIIALNKAIDISLNNVPVYNGKTLIALDVSGSMEGKPAEIGSLFAAALAKSNDADLILFSDYAKYRNINPADSVMSIAENINFACGGTNMRAIFDIADKAYDRIIILSDMQGWIGYDTPVRNYESYKKRTGANPYIYSFDLQGYGTLQLPADKICLLTGFSEKVFDLMKILETDKNALINKIKAIEL